MNTAERLPAVRKLCEIPTPYDWTGENDSLFVQAMREICQWHIEQSPAYAARCAQFDFRPEQLRSVEDCTSIPYFLATVFKYHEILSIPRDQVSLHLTSSGTGGQKSQIFFDPWSIAAPQRMLDWIFEYHGWRTLREPANYLLFTYESEPDTKLGTAYTDHYLCRYAPVESVFYW